MRILDCSQLDMSIYENTTCQRSKKSTIYNNLVCAFDIETTVIDYCGDPHSVMYVWQFAIEQDCYIGRTWAEFSTFVGKVVENLRGQLIVWVHNLSYEFQFISAILPFTNENIFTVKSRRVLKCTSGQLEFRCSYLQSGCSLDKFLSDMQVEHKKVKGFDYSKPRYYFTDLTPEEMEYITHDVIGLTEAIHKRLEMRGDSLATIPLTNTGYCRQDAKKAIERFHFLDTLKPDLETYLLEHFAFRGGDTHANRFKAGYTLKNVKCYDRSSSYPDVICNCLFPMSEFKKTDNSKKTLLKRYGQGYAFIIHFVATNVKLRNRYTPNPYLPFSKCRIHNDAICDNGRILQASYIEHTCTDVDWGILVEQYEWSGYEILDLRIARYGKLPQKLIDLVIEYYRMKTSLKGVEGKEIDYAMSKAKLNSYYGMMCQALIKNVQHYDSADCWDTEQDFEHYQLIDDMDDLTPKEKDEIQAQFDKNKSMTKLNYAWACWVTAHARERLYQLIQICGDNIVYWDTDSVFYEGDHDFTEYNERCIKDSTESGAFADAPDGTRYYMGCADLDKECIQFKTLGAKKYCYTDAKGFHITVAGVPKKAGAAQMVARFGESGVFDAFTTDYIFRSESQDGIPGTGKLQTLYNDKVHYGTVTIDNHKIEVTRNVVLLPADYELSISSGLKCLPKLKKKDAENLLKFLQ